jgi:YfiH family protein
VAPDDEPPADGGAWADADIAMTTRRDLALSVRVADCVPILLADAETGAVAAVHAGWRGTADGAVLAAVTAMAGEYGTRPTDLVAAVGPSIGPCCYRVGAEVRDQFATAGRPPGDLDRWFTAEPAGMAACGIPGTDPAAANGRQALFLDTWAGNADQLVGAGIPASQVHVARLCASCHRDILHSHRVDGPRAGRMAAIIRRR